MLHDGASLADNATLSSLPMRGVGAGLENLASEELLRPLLLGHLINLPPVIKYAWGLPSQSEVGAVESPLASIDQQL